VFVFSNSTARARLWLGDPGKETAKERWHWTREMN
jgi:hypothetical protein